MAIDLDAVLSGIANIITIVVNFLRGLTFDVGGTTFSYWVFLLAVFVISVISLIIFRSDE